MKVLFIYVRFGGKDADFADLSFRAPLGITYLAAVARKSGFEASIIDGLFYTQWDKFKEDLNRIKPDIVGLGFTTLRKKEALNYIDIIKKVLPDAVLIAGGPHATISSEELLTDFKVDYVIQGEGEKTLPDLLTFIRDKGKGENDIKGIAYLLDGNVQVNPPREFITDLDEIPWPARDLLPMNKYLSTAPLLPLPYPSTTIVVSRGCPGNCLFCQPTLKQLTGQKVRYRSVDKVIEEIKFLIKEYHVKSIELGVDEPTYNKEWVENFCNALIKEKIRIWWGAPSRVDTVNKELLEKMAKAGCVYISYGIESGSQKMMNILRKGTIVKQAENALKWTEKAGICGRANLMVGSPGETKETIRESVDFVKKVKPDFIFVAATTPLFGTDLYDLAKREGMLVETNSGIRGYDVGHLKLEELSNDEVKKGIDGIVKAYKRNLVAFIFNPIMLYRKRHIYLGIFRYFFSLLKNRKEFFRMLKYYMRYGKHIEVKGE